MSRYKDNAPVPHTCPKIDEVISAIESVEWPEDNYWSEEMAKAIMEEIRKANEELRRWGNEMNIEAENRQDTIDDLEDEVKRLRSDNEDYEKRIRQLEKELEEATA